MDPLSLLFLGTERVFQSKNAIQNLSEKGEAWKSEGVANREEKWGSVSSVAPLKVSLQEKNPMTVTKTERTVLNCV